jgi:hypothetical protein
MFNVNVIFNSYLQLVILLLRAERHGKILIEKRRRDSEKFGNHWSIRWSLEDSYSPGEQILMSFGWVRTKVYQDKFKLQKMDNHFIWRVKYILDMPVFMSLDYYELKQNKPWLDKEWKILLVLRKQAQLLWLWNEVIRTM